MTILSPFRVSEVGSVWGSDTVPEQRRDGWTPVRATRGSRSESSSTDANVTGMPSIKFMKKPGSGCAVRDDIRYFGSWRIEILK